MFGSPRQQDQQQIDEAQRVRGMLAQIANYLAWSCAFSVLVIIRLPWTSGRKFVDLKSVIGAWVVIALFIVILPQGMSPLARAVLSTPRYEAVTDPSGRVMRDPHGRVMVRPVNPYAGMPPEVVEGIEREMRDFDLMPLVVFGNLVLLACVAHKLFAHIRYLRGDRITDNYSGDSVLTPLLGRWFSQMTLWRFVEGPLVFGVAFVATALTGSVAIMAYLIVAALCVMHDAALIWWREYELAKVGGNELAITRARMEMMRRMRR